MAPQKVVIMERVKSIVFRNLTNADFFNINKPPGMELRGGGQAYIDFPTSSVTPGQWQNFFSGIHGVAVQQETQGPSWTFPVYSLRVDDSHSHPNQELKIYQRRQQSVCITSQKLQSSRSNRVKAWHPRAGFPYPIDNTNTEQCPDGLMVYLAATDSGKVWAGWYLNDGTTALPIKGILSESIAKMFSYPSNIEGYSGIINFQSTDNVYINADDQDFPLQTYGDATYTSNVYNPANEEEEFIETLFSNDGSGKENFTREYLTKIRVRNKSLVADLKRLYNNTCQITGTEFAFQKKDGVDYTEVHHLIPLGEGGSDEIKNLIVVNPLIHKMFHHADVEQIDLNNIKIDGQGYGHLNIYISNKQYEIIWHPRHLAAI